MKSLGWQRMTDMGLNFLPLIFAHPSRFPISRLFAQEHS